MADGTQRGFNFPRNLPVSQLRPGEIVVDLFAGGGGASEALRQALGHDPDIAINHDATALGLHAANHPFTRHMAEDVWQADPVRVTAGRAIGWFHASPDCTHFSQAKGGQPRSRATRSLSWVVLKWAGKLARTDNAPRIISLENVEQILTWGPLVAKRDKATGRVIKLDGSVAARGERVSVWQQALVPDKRHAGRTWAQFIAALHAIGYTVEWRKLIASDYGAGTSRKRLFLIARRDGQPIVWPAPTHGTAPGLQPLVTAADCIDFTVPCPSIFTRQRPLADATLRRIAKGLMRYVIDAAEPFIVSIRPIDPTEETQHGVSTWQNLHRQDHTVQRGGDRPRHLHQRMQPGSACATREQRRSLARGGVVRRATPGPCGSATNHAGQLENARPGQDGAQALTQPFDSCGRGGVRHAAAAHLVKFRGTSDGGPLDVPLPTITSGAGAKRPAGAAHAMGVITAFLEQANGGYAADGPGHAATDPMSTITSAGSQQRLVMCTLEHPASQCAEMFHGVPARCSSPLLPPDQEAGALRVAAFLVKYYGTAHGVNIAEPLDTITTRDRLALVTVTIKGTPYVIVDIGLRMLRRDELFRAQGFPPGYVIDRTASGKPLSISASVRMVGNSVSPPPLCALARANLDPAKVPERIAA